MRLLDDKPKLGRYEEAAFEGGFSVCADCAAHQSEFIKVLPTTAHKHEPSVDHLSQRAGVGQTLREETAGRCAVAGLMRKAMGIWLVTRWHEVTIESDWRATLSLRWPFAGWVAQTACR